MVENSVSAVITRLLGEDADEAAIEQARRLIYEELRVIARSLRRNGGGGSTLCTTALVNEAYLKLAGSDCPIEGRKHFYAMAARAMRQILIDYLRSRTSAKRSPAGRLLEVDEVVDQLGTRNVDLLALDEALIRLAGIDRRKARVVELRFFGGLDNARTAEVLGVSRATIERDWVFARAWLRRELDAEASDGR